MPNRGIVHKSQDRALEAQGFLGNTLHFGYVFHIGTKVVSAKFTVEKRRRTPYGTRSYLLGGAA
jgi:hypothetical protein